MRVLFDTNVILDVLLNREPFVDHSEPLVALVNGGALEGVLSATSVTTVYYFLRKQGGDRAARQRIISLLRSFAVAPVTRRQLTSALGVPFADYEDAVLHEAARAARADVIVTRDERDFANAVISVMNPPKLLSTIVGIA